MRKENEKHKRIEKREITGRHIGREQHKTEKQGNKQEEEGEREARK